MIGRTVKSYVVEDMLGKGGMGIVYRARDTKLNRPVALKFLPPDLVRDVDRRRRFLQEARAASAVNHPAITQIYDIEESGDETFIVMEYVDGSPLTQLVARRELDAASAVEVAIQVGDALAHAHAAGIVHRDIKPDNIMLTRNGHPKILDFGLAKLLDHPSVIRAGADSLAETAAPTQAGMIVGTPSYMSPEQARGLPAGTGSDIFSFGIVLYQMLTGKLPFEGASALDTMHAIAYDNPEPLATVRTGLPNSLQRVVDRCLRKMPEERYQEMREVVSDLRQVRREMDTGISSAPPVMERLRSWAGGLSTRGAIYAALAGAILGGIAVNMVFGQGRNTAPDFLFLGVIGTVVYRWFRNRGQREMRKFVRKASTLREVRLIAFQSGEFLVIVDDPTARTYVKLNGLLTTANTRLFRGDPMTMTLRDDVPPADTRLYLSSPGVQYVRDDALTPKSKRTRRWT